MAKSTVTIEQIKKESLKRLGVVLSDNIDSATIPELIEKDDTYAQYLRNMDGPINAAVKRMVEEDVLPIKTFSLPFAEEYGDGITLKNRVMYVDVEELIPELCEVKSIDHITGMGDIYTDMDYGVIGAKELVLPMLKAGQEYKIHYSYIPKTVSWTMPLSEFAQQWRENKISEGETGDGAYNKNVLDIPDELANIIPYFVFGELYMHDEPTVAMYQGTNRFEAYLSEYKPKEHTKNNKIFNIFGGFN